MGEKHKRIASHDQDGKTIHDDDYHSGDDAHEANGGAQPHTDMNKCMFLRKKFPKFIIGYLSLSLIISALIIPMTYDNYAERFVKNINQISRWLFTLGFIGIGAKTKFTTLWDAIKDGKYLALYH